MAGDSESVLASARTAEAEPNPAISARVPIRSRKLRRPPFTVLASRTNSNSSVRRLFRPRIVRASRLRLERVLVAPTFDRIEAGDLSPE
jgi:hypothetical protein